VVKGEGSHLRPTAQAWITPLSGLRRDAHVSDEDFSKPLRSVACYLAVAPQGVASLCHHVEIRHRLSGMADYLLQQDQ
jgi:hypothetical protein